MNVKIENVSRIYGSVKALDGVSLTIADGELFFLLGASGCGKTTLLRCIGGFEQPSSGKIYLGNEDVTGLPPYKRSTGMVFQGYALWPHKTVFENVVFGLEMQKLPKEERIRRANQALEQVQIANLADRKPNELSGGQQQRVALARTLVTRPACLLLDEPLANLDAKLRRDMRLEIRRICKESGLTAIYVTHDRQEALSMADRIAVMNAGKVIQLDAPKTVYRHPASSFVANFIGETNLIPGKVVEANGEGGTVETAVAQLAVRNLNGHKSGEAVILAIRPEALYSVPSDYDGNNSMDATVEYVDYLGEIADHGAIAAGNIKLKFSELNPKQSFSPGESLRLAVAPDDITVMAE